jgi:hypothetical protein
MRRHSDLPSLQIVPTNSLFAHEDMEAGRADPLVHSLEADGVLRNPPLVSPLDKQADRFVVLDGANRFAAFRYLGLPHILVQIVDPEIATIDLKSWSHVLIGSSADRRSLRASLEDHLRSGLPADDDLNRSVLFHLGQGEIYRLRSDGEDLHSRVGLIREAMARYLGRFRVERSVSTRLQGLEKVYPDLAGLVRFPVFSLEDVFAIARDSDRLPAGLTRFVVSPRVLHVNYPLEELRRHAPLALKRRSFEKWLAERIRARAVRFYGESTFLFDE